MRDGMRLKNKSKETEKEEQAFAYSALDAAMHRELCAPRALHHAAASCEFVATAP